MNSGPNSPGGEPTLIAPALHRPRRCPVCRRPSTAILTGPRGLPRCHVCRLDADERDRAILADLTRVVWTNGFKARWITPPQPHPPHVPPDPATCTGCGRTLHGIADRKCLSCRLTADGT